jgi:hypothetical protein
VVFPPKTLVSGSLERENRPKLFQKIEGMLV